MSKVLAFKDRNAFKTWLRDPSEKLIAPYADKVNAELDRQKQAIDTSLAHRQGMELVELNRRAPKKFQPGYGQAVPPVSSRLSRRPSTSLPRLCVKIRERRNKMIRVELSVRFHGGTPSSLPRIELTRHQLEDKLWPKDTEWLVLDNQPATPKSGDPAILKEVVELCNRHRSRPLRLDPELCKSAMEHAKAMASKRSLQHMTMPQLEIIEVYAENIFAPSGPVDAEIAVQGWLKSRPHKENIVNLEYTKIGVGFAEGSDGKIYWCQHFRF